MLQKGPFRSAELLPDVIVDEIALAMARKGKGTGWLSKIASEAVLLLLPVTVSAMVAHGLWLPAVLLVVLSVAGAHQAFELALAVWAALSGAWWAVALLLVRVVMGAVAAFAGLSHAQKSVRHGWPTFSPFLAYSPPLSTVAGALLLIAVPWLSGTWLLACAALAALALSVRALGMAGRLWPRWRQIEGPFGHMWAVEAALEQNRAEQSHGEFDVAAALTRVLVRSFEGHLAPGEMAAELLRSGGLCDPIAGECSSPGEAVQRTLGQLLELRFGADERDRYWRCAGFTP